MQNAVLSEELLGAFTDCTYIHTSIQLYIHTFFYNLGQHRNFLRTLSHHPKRYIFFYALKVAPMIMSQKCTLERRSITVCIKKHLNVTYNAFTYETQYLALHHTSTIIDNNWACLKMHSYILDFTIWNVKHSLFF